MVVKMIANRRIRAPKSFIIVFIVVGALTWVLRSVDLTIADVTPYTDSAHGTHENGIGVYRTSMVSFGYARGNCAHCHEAHGSVAGSEPAPNQGNIYKQFYLQFDNPGKNQNSGFCLDCHIGFGSQQDNMVANYDYSKRRGGSNKSFPNSVVDAFYFIDNDTAQPRNNNGHLDGSAHFLLDVRNKALNGNWGWVSDRSTMNPCLGCHEPHRAQQNWPCSLPSGHDDVYTWEVWGDDADEKMITYAGVTYQPPYKIAPGQEWSNADEAPDYVALCRDCHSRSLYSTRYGADLDEITMTMLNQEDVHLMDDRQGTPFGGKKPPYDTYPPETNLILMCTDCHEPHGSENYMLLRTRVNGQDNISVTDYDDNDGVASFCKACHTVEPSHENVDPEIGCLGRPGVGFVGCHNHDRYL
jgi:hypothetical protein